VQEQEYPFIEYIIVDGQSEDHTLAVVNSYGQVVTCVITERDTGIYDAMNKGLALAAGDIVGFLNSDDFYVSTHTISNMVKKLEESGTDAIYADIDYVDRNNPEKIIRRWRSGEYRKKRFYYGWMPPHPTFFVKKSIYDKLGGYNLEQHLAADYELMLRFLFKHEISCCYLPEVMVKMRVGGVSNKSWRNRIIQNAENRQAWRINNIKPKWYTLILKPLIKIRQYI
jgi:glycosyltransferase involved in cell wall biosynthesis